MALRWVTLLHREGALVAARWATNEVTEHLMARSGTDLKMAKLVMTSPNHPTSDIEDAFSSNFPDYVPASPGKTYSNSSNNSFESPIPPPTIVPPSTMLSQMFNPQEFFLPEELLSPKKQGHNQSFSSTSALPQEFKIGESSSELQKAHARIAKLQRKQMGNNNKITLSRFRIANLEQIIKEIQVCHQADKESLLNAIYELKNSQKGPSNIELLD
ncbi:hypothetical protein Tco_0701525 [Tanacetum coccineum]